MVKHRHLKNIFLENSYNLIFFCIHFNIYLGINIPQNNIQTFTQLESEAFQCTTQSYNSMYLFHIHNFTLLIQQICFAQKINNYIVLCFIVSRTFYSWFARIQSCRLEEKQPRLQSVQKISKLKFFFLRLINFFLFVANVCELFVGLVRVGVYFDQNFCNQMI